MKHPGEEALAAHVDDHDDRITEHVVGCPSCGRILADYEVLTHALRDSTAWPEQVTEDSLLEDRELIVRDEERSALVLLEALASTPIASWSARLPRTAGTVRSLLSWAHGQLESEPHRAFAIAELADRLAADVPDEQDQRYLRGWAQREQANALRYLGRYLEALHALEEAQKNFEGLPTGEFDIGCVLYIRSGLLREQRHLDEAREAATESARIFALFGESLREMHARLVLANIDYDDGRLVQAREQYEKLLRARALRDDELTLARVHHNLGSTLQQMGEYGSARRELTIARKTFDRLGRHTEAARVQWVLARTTLSEGSLLSGQEELRSAIATLTKHGMGVDAALARLDLAESLLENGDPHGARGHCTAIIEDLVQAGMSIPAATAMDTLRHAAAHDQLTLAVVRQTRVMLLELTVS